MNRLILLLGIRGVAITRMVWVSIRLSDPRSSEVRLMEGSSDSLASSPGREKSLLCLAGPFLFGWWVGGNRDTDAEEEGRGPTAGSAEEEGLRFLAYEDSSEGSAEVRDCGGLREEVSDREEPIEPLRCSLPPGSDD